MSRWGRTDIRSVHRNPAVPQHPNPAYYPQFLYSPTLAGVGFRVIRVMIVTEPQCPTSLPSFSISLVGFLFSKSRRYSLPWWHTPVISSPGKMRHKGDKFEASLGKVVRLSQKIMAGDVECLPRMHRALASVLHHIKQV